LQEVAKEFGDHWLHLECACAEMLFIHPHWVDFCPDSK